MQKNCTTVQFSQLLKSVILSLESLLSEKEISIEVKSDSDAVVFIDKGLIEQVLINLLSNAIKYGSVGKQLLIEYFVHEEKSQKFLYFSVTDYGIGIPEEEVEHVFDAFTQSSKTDTLAGGTGLGLPICKEIISVHNGEIWAESPLWDGTEGSKFIFYIPVARSI